MISIASSESRSRTTSLIRSLGIEFEDFFADRVVDLGERHPVEIMAHQPHERFALVRLKRMQDVAEIGFVQVGDERPQRLAVMPLDRPGDAPDKGRIELPVLIADGEPGFFRTGGGFGFHGCSLRTSRAASRDL